MLLLLRGWRRGTQVQILRVHNVFVGCVGGAVRFKVAKRERLAKCLLMLWATRLDFLYVLRLRLRYSDIRIRNCSRNFAT